MRDWRDEEIAVVVAHELAHHAHHDLWKSWVLDAAVIVCATAAADALVSFAAPARGLTGPAEPAAVPLVALAAVGVWSLASPLRLALSRRHERRADTFALEMTGDASAFRAAVRRLAASHQAEERPSRLTRWFFLRHPPVAARLAAADRFEQGSRQRV
jgi:STE24 endopeptidase